EASVLGVPEPVEEGVVDAPRAFAVGRGVGADDLGDLGEGVAGGEVRRVDEGVLDGEWVGVAEVAGAVAGVAEEGGEPDVAVVVLAGGEGVGAPGGRVGAGRELEGAERAVPGGAVVEAGLPGVADGDEPAGVEVAGG